MTQKHFIAFAKYIISHNRFTEEEDRFGQANLATLALADGKVKQ